MDTNKCNQIIFLIVELILLIAILCVSFSVDNFAIKISLDSIISIGLTFTFVFNFKINMTFIKNANIVSIEQVGKIEANKILLNNQKSNDVIVIEELKKYLEDFVISYKSGIITIEGPFKNANFDCIYSLEGYLISPTCTFKNENLENLKNELKKNVFLLLNRMSKGSFPVSGVYGLNIFRYFELEEEKLISPERVDDEHLQNAKKDFDEAQAALDNIVKYYDEIIKYSIKNL